MGTLEQISADIQANTAALNAIASRMGAPAPAVLQAPQVMAPTAAIPVIAPQVMAPTAAPAVTSDQIMALIQPHLGNDTMKAAFGDAMRRLGINALPEAPAHMFGQLYQAFQGVIGQFTGAAGAAPPAGSSII